jgi:hypothetical protein
MLVITITLVANGAASKPSGVDVAREAGQLLHAIYCLLVM